MVPSNLTAIARQPDSQDDFHADVGSPFWWTLVSTLILGVGIGVLSLSHNECTIHDGEIQQRIKQGSLN